MSITEEFSLTATDGTLLDGRYWAPETAPCRGLVIIVHGMAEHMDRYLSLAGFLTTAGLAVAGINLRGHGPKAVQPGWFGPGKGWAEILEDITLLRSEMEQRYPEVPQFILGHSLGSFLVRRYMIQPGTEPPAGVILSGSAQIGPAASGLMRLLAGAGIRFKGEREKSPLLHHLAFAVNNIPYRKEGQTGVDWLSRDTDSNLRYTADPLCGFVCSFSFYRELGRGLSVIDTKQAFHNWPAQVPLLIISGNRDPIGNNGKGPMKLEQRYRKGGVSDLSLHLIDGARHEILNETDREETWAFILNWINAHT